MHASFTTRARVLLVLTIAALCVSAAAIPLALHARGDGAAARTLVTEDLVFAASVAEIRVLSLQLQYAAAQAALRPGDGTYAARFSAERHRTTEELRRARLHAPERDAVDAIDELENSVLRFSAIAERVFAAAAAGQEGEARRGVLMFAGEGQLLEELGEELATIAGAATEQRARGLDGNGRAAALAAVALAGLVLAAEAFVLAVCESGRAIALALSAITPDRWQHHLPWDEGRPPVLPAATAAGENGSADEEGEDGPQPLYTLNPEQAAAMAAALKQPAESAPAAEPESRTAAA